MNIRAIERAIELEHKRQELAKKRNYAELAHHYGLAESIPNNNTSRLWNGKNKIMITKKQNPMAWHRTRIMANWVKKFHPKSVLNIGFGPCNLENLLLRADKYIEFSTWVGIDISNESVFSARREYPMCEFRNGNFLLAKFDNEKYEMIIASEVLEHISPKNTIKFIKKIFDLCTEKGYFICSVPLNEGLEQMVLNGINPNAHTRMYTPDLIKAELSQAGFQVKQEAELYAFHKHYELKSFIGNIFKMKSNNIIILAQKP